MHLSKLSVVALWLGAVTALEIPVGFPPTLPSPTSTLTTTIPWIGSYPTSVTLIPCVGPATVVFEVPFDVPTCTADPSPSCTAPSPTTLSTTATTTLSTTVTTTSLPSGAPSACAVNPLCSDSGLNIDYYHNSLGYYGTGHVSPNYYVTQGLTLLKSSTTNITYVPVNTDPNLPKVYPNASFPDRPYYVGWTRNTNGGITVDANNFTLVYQGFYRAPSTGSYQLCTTADNENAVFFGAGNAFSCLDGKVDPSTQPLITSTSKDYVKGLSCANVSLVKGSYYPIRSVYGNWQGLSAFNLTVGLPGTTFADRTHDFTGDVAPHSCGVYA